MNATKRPWVTFQNDNKHIIFQEEEDVTIAVTSGWDSPYRGEEAANARLIVTAVNNFDEMVEALTNAVKEIGGHSEIGCNALIKSCRICKVREQARALLAKVKEG